ncbi:hypothetical protein [Verrucosispora sp. WMMD573]|uniref:hypothetical protein n=1 Tax=Verrucosispora sp. WMMD573 TaxID=3015149 RepID=UPI00248CF603|nr:hypothetical protein [Verrucosispora sp. WMMD573]WBB52737.1 hypothetical protein O7601_19365 [Verrucosispora sp. WMMD573]
MRVRPGATLIVNGGSISGPVDASGAAGFVLTDSTVDGPVNVTGTTGPVLLVGNRISGPVNVVNSTGVAPLLAGNTVNGPLGCTGNAAAPVNIEVANAVSGPRFSQCARL